LFDPAKCIQCRQCGAVCPNGATLNGPDGPRYERRLCRACGACVENCYAEARTLAGRRVTAREVAAEVLRDAPFFAASRGGVTLGGGEPLAQPLFAAAILRECRERHIHTAVETCGHVPWPQVERVLPWTDLFLYDIKHLDPTRHQEMTEGDISLILSNLSGLVAAGAQVTIRTPIVPGFNDTADAIRTIAEHVIACGLDEIHLLPYHRLGESKYRLLGRDYPFRGGDNVPEARLKLLAAIAEAVGLRVGLGG
jgi:pyruvate formate lyase activating enzyme